MTTWTITVWQLLDGGAVQTARRDEGRDSRRSTASTATRDSSACIDEVPPFFSDGVSIKKFPINLDVILRDGGKYYIEACAHELWLFAAMTALEK